LPRGGCLRGVVTDLPESVVEWIRVVVRVRIEQRRHNRRGHDGRGHILVVLL
jgi:hypothetical protein